MSFPERLRASDLVVLGQRQLTAEEEIGERVLVQDTVNGDALLARLEVNPVVAGTVTEKFLAIALDAPEPPAAVCQPVEVFGQNLKFAQ